MKKNVYIFPVSLILFFVLTFFIVLVKIYNFSSNFILLLYLIFFCLICFLILIKKKFNVFIINSVILIFFLIFYHRTNLTESFYASTLNSFKDVNSILGYINSFPKIKKDKIEYKVKIIGVKYDNREDYTKIKPFNIIFNLKGTKEINYKNGDLVVINKKVSIPREKIFDFNYRKYLYYHNIYGLVNANPENSKLIDDNINFFLINRIFKQTIYKFRDNLVSRLREALSEESFSFILSIYFGERDKMDEELYDAFCNTGMVHLLAISGLHIGFIGMIFFFFFKLFLSKSKALVISVILLFVYMLIIVPSASSLRAFLMYTLFVFYFVTGMRTSRISILSFSGIILLFYNPFIIFDLGFQFSYLATAGILFLSEPISNKLPKIIHKKIKSSIAVTISAFLSVFVLQWATFKRVPLFSILSSILIVPLFGLIFSGTFFMLILFFFTNLSFLAKVIDVTIYLFLKIIKILDLIKAINLPGIPKFLSYLFLPLIILYFYQMEPFVKKIFIKKKSKKVEQLLINTKTLIFNKDINVSIEDKEVI